MNFYGLASKRRRENPFDWTARTSSFGSTSIWGIGTDGSGTYVAVGSGGKLATSTNAGVTWTQQTSSFGATNINNVVYDAGNSLWIAIGSTGKLATAPAADITTWTQRTSSYGTTDIYGLGTDGSGNSITVGESQKMADSTNGTSWTQRTSTLTTLGTDAAFGNSIWVAVGGDNNDITTSTNRTSWTDRANSLTSLYNRGVVYGSNIWVVVAYNGEIASASNPTSTWTNRTSGLAGTDNINCVNYGNGYFFAGADDGLYTWSTDGIHWNDSTIPAFTAGTNNIRRIAYDATDDIWVAVGISGILATSPGS